MTPFEIFIAVALLGFGSVTAILLDRAFRAEARQRRLPQKSADIELTGPNKALLTRNERWAMETEHELRPHSPRHTFQHVGCRICGPGPLKKHEIPSQYDHVFFGDVRWTDSYGWQSFKRVKTSIPAEADVVSSQIEGTKWHTPMLDVDMPVRVIESSTPGHHHVYIDAPMRWWRYRTMLWGLKVAGVIEPGFYNASKKRKATHLRPPWVEKADAA